MAPRERIEDLGRIAEMLDEIWAGDLLRWDSKHSADAFDLYLKGLIEKEEVYDELFMPLVYLRQKLQDIWCVARFGDDEEANC